MDTAKLIEGMIPEDLRLHGHRDAALVNEAIATVIAAMNDSSALTLAGQRSDVRKALQAYYVNSFMPHINEEDELWGKTKALADLAPKPHELATKGFDEAVSDADYDAAMDHATTILPSLDAEGRAHIKAGIKRYHARQKHNIAPAMTREQQRANDKAANDEYRAMELNRAFNIMRERAETARDNGHRLGVDALESTLIVPVRTPEDENHNAAVHAEALKLATG